MVILLATREEAVAQLWRAGSGLDRGKRVEPFGCHKFLCSVIQHPSV